MANRINVREFLNSKRYRAKATCSADDQMQYQCNKRVTPELQRTLQHAISSEIARFIKENGVRFGHDDYGRNVSLNVYILSDEDIATVVNAIIEDQDG